MVVAVLSRRRYRAAAFAIAVMIATSLTTTAIKLALGRGRPEWQDATDLLSSKSFPSGHASSSAAWAGILIFLAWSFLRRPAARWAVTVVAVGVWVAVCLDRVLLGRHYPSDVVAGSVLGVSMVLLGIAVFDPARVRVHGRSVTGASSPPRPAGGGGGRPRRAAGGRRPGGGARPAGLHEVRDALLRGDRAPPQAGAAADPGDVPSGGPRGVGGRSPRAVGRGHHREERYAATALARHRAARPWQDPAALDLYRHLVVTGAWWDHVDEVASHLVGGVLAGHRDDVTPVMRAWAVDDDLWVRRTAVLCQLNHRADTDVDLLRDVVEANVDDRSFWLRKAIGWALREHSKTDPDWVRAEVDRFGDRLSGLSRREAGQRTSAGA